jgi:hypothetical protein
MLKRAITTLLAAGSLLLAGQAPAQEVKPDDPNTWPAYFDGLNALGPYAWVDGPTHLQSDPQLANGVYGGEAGNLKLYVCRAKQEDGVHPGKYFNNQCNISWGGQEIALTSDYELLVNTQPDNAQFLAQNWAIRGDASATFWGGYVGTTPMRVCQTWAQDGTHLGKEFAGRCYYGWDGQEVASPEYAVLSLGFDKAAWQAQVTTYTMTEATIPDPKDPCTWPAYFTGGANMGPYAWVDGPTHLQSDPTLANGVKGARPEATGGFTLYVCRARQQDGVHPGKFFNGQCNISWGGQEIALTSGYELLVNTQPKYAQFLERVGVLNFFGYDPDETRWFVAGAVGDTPLLACKSWAPDGNAALGKFWEGRCYFGYDKQELSSDNYYLLYLPFDKAAWLATTPPTTDLEWFTAWSNCGKINLTYPLTLNQEAAGLTIPPASELNIDTTNYVARSMAVLDSLMTRYLQFTWQYPLEPGLGDVATHLPNLMYAMIDSFNAAQTDTSLRIDRDVILGSLRGGDDKTLSIVIPLMAQLGKTIVDRDPATWTVDEEAYVNYLQVVLQDQRVRAAGLAKQAFKAWKEAEAEKAERIGFYAAFLISASPPPEILAQAQAGYVVPPGQSARFEALVGGIGAAVATIGTVALIAGAKLLIGTVVGVKLGAMAIMGVGGGAVAIPVLMVIAGTVKTIELVKYGEFVNQLNAAVAAAQDPVTTDTLKQLLSTAEGMTTMILCLISQAATGSV